MAANTAKGAEKKDTRTITFKNKEHRDFYKEYLYEKTSTVFTSNKTFSQWNEVFADVTIASAILDRVLHHCTVVNIKGESYRLKERKEFMRQKQQIVNTLFEQGNA